MKKRVCKILCLVSGGVFFALALYLGFLVFSVRNAPPSVGASIGIIGGADAPTMVFLLRKVAQTPVFHAAIVSFFLFAGTGLALIFRKKSNK